MQNRERPFRPGLIFVFVLWVGGLALFIQKMWAFSMTPGLPARAPALWPTVSQITPSTQKPNLVLFVTPTCSCSRATLAELHKLLVQTGPNLRTTLVLNRFDDQPLPPYFTDLENWPGLRVLDDREDREAHLFGARTAGQALLYNPDGHLIYSGGLTASRGHEGDNAGSMAILAAVQHSGAILPRLAPVFGCNLLSAGTKVGFL